MLAYSTQIKYSIISVFGSVSPRQAQPAPHSVQHQFSTSSAPVGPSCVQLGSCSVSDPKAWTS